MSTSQRSWCEGSGLLEPGHGGSRHLLYRLEGCRYQEKKASRGRWQERKREGEGEGGKDWDDDRTKAQRSSLCQFLCETGSVLGLPHPIKAHQCLVCFKNKLRPLLGCYWGAQRPASAGTPRGGYRARRQPLPLAPVAAKKKTRLVTAPLCGNNRALPARERKSRTMISPFPPLPSLRGNVGVEVI